MKHLIVGRRMGWQRMLLLCVLWLIPVCWSAYGEISPVLRTKRVTVTLSKGGSAQFIFSAAQPDNEVIYAMKSIYAPALAQTPERFLGQSTDTPYREFVAEKLPPKLGRVAAWMVGLLALVLGGLWVFRNMTGARPTP